MVTLFSKAPPPSPVAIVGSRNYPDLERVRAFVRGLPEGTWVISGRARGVDVAAETAARKRRLPFVAFWPERDGTEYRIRLAEWTPHGTMEATVGFADTFAKAAHLRNQLMVDRAALESGGVVAFWDGQSKGTLSTINKARSAGILHAVYGPNGEVME